MIEELNAEWQAARAEFAKALAEEAAARAEACIQGMVPEEAAMARYLATRWKRMFGSVPVWVYPVARRNCWGGWEFRLVSDDHSPEIGERDLRPLAWENSFN